MNLLSDKELRSVVRASIIESESSLKEFRIDKVSGGVNYEMCDLSGIPQYFFDYFATIRSGQKDKFLEKYDEDIKKFEKLHSKDTATLQNLIADLESNKKATINDIDKQIAGLKDDEDSGVLDLLKPDSKEQEKEDGAIKGFFKKQAQKFMFDKLEDKTGIDFRRYGGEFNSPDYEPPKPTDFTKLDNLFPGAKLKALRMRDDPLGMGDLMDDIDFSDIYENKQLNEFISLPDIFSSGSKKEKLIRSKDQAIDAYDEQIAKIQSKIDSGKYNKKLAKIKKNKEIMKKDKDGSITKLFMKMSKALNENAIFAMLGPGANIAASAVLGLSKSDCDAIKEAIQDFLNKFLGPLVGIMYGFEYKPQNFVRSGSSSSDEEDKSDGKKGGGLFAKDISRHLKENGLIDNDKRKEVIDRSSTPRIPSKILDFDLDLFELVANEEYLAFVKDENHNLNKAARKLKDYKNTIRRFDTSFNMISNYVANGIQLSDLNRQEKIRKFFSQTVPYKEYFKEPKDCRIFFGERIDNIIDELDMD